jgi:hypothetical protein
LFCFNKRRRHWLLRGRKEGRETSLQERGKGERRKGEQELQTNFIQLPVLVVRKLFLILYLELEYFYKSLALLQIISLYLTALFSWLWEGEVNQSLTAQNLAGPLNDNVHPGLGWA